MGVGVSAHPWAAVRVQVLGRLGSQGPGTVRPAAEGSGAAVLGSALPGLRPPYPMGYAIIFHFRFSENCFCQRLWS